jgi:diguanylate cyclase (GGDEF)-like protein
MRRALAAVLALALALPALAADVAAPGDGTDPGLQAEIDRLSALRGRDPQAFVAQVRSLDTLPPPTSVGQREQLAFLRAHRFALQGRFAEAIGLARPLAEAAEDPGLRLRAGAFVVNLLAGTREFEAGLRLLGDLLKANPAPSPGLEAEQLRLWSVAAIFYNELGQPALAIDFADRVIGARPPAAVDDVCGVMVQREMARQAQGDPTQADADFRAAEARCGEGGVTHIAFAALAEARFLRARDRRPEALALMEARLGAIESTNYPRLVAEAYALDAELLFADGRLDAAERQARRAVEVSRDLPTSRPVAMAEKVLHDVARARGDTGAALRHLQNHVAATRALAEDARIKALAFRTVQHEQLQRERELAWLGERHRVLDLEAQAAKAESRDSALALAVLVLCVGGLGAWGWRLLQQERRFREVARSDALTGFANRVHFNACAEAALARAARQGSAVALVAFDLDHFKRINDQHGHLAGDAVLRGVAAAVRGVPVAAGVKRTPGRIGGEEFVLLLEGATPEQALGHAEACRAAIAATRTTLESGGVVAVTASFGVAGMHESGPGLDALLAAADRALYRAKAAGRDRVGHVEAREAA